MFEPYVRLRWFVYRWSNNCEDQIGSRNINIFNQKIERNTHALSFENRPRCPTRQQAQSLQRVHNYCQSFPTCWSPAWPWCAGHQDRPALPSSPTVGARCRRWTQPAAHCWTYGPTNLTLLLLILQPPEAQWQTSRPFNLTLHLQLQIQLQLQILLQQPNQLNWHMLTHWLRHRVADQGWL